MPVFGTALDHAASPLCELLQAMPFSTSIGIQTIAVRSADPLLLAWLDELVGGPVASDVTAESRLVVYGDDYNDFLSTDNHEQKLSRCHAALCLANPVALSYLDLYRHNVRHIIYRNEPFSREAFRLAALTAGPRKALVACNDFREFQPPPVIVDSMECAVVSVDDSQTLQACTEQFYSRHKFGEDLKQAINLCLKEAITNAIFHGFRESGTHTRKYIPETFHGLYDSDYVAVAFTLTQEWLAVRVWDNSGSLGPLSVANSLDRHLTNKGLMDTRGRGFYLMQHLAQRLVVCVRRREETSVQMYFLLNQKPTDAPRHLEVIAL